MTAAPPVPWSACVLTLYPDMFPGPLAHALAGQALKSGVWALKTLDIRGFAQDKHRSVDDTPAGGGPGMVLRADVLGRAVDAALALEPATPVIALTPRGRPITQARVRELAAGPHLIVLCGHYEGIDQRVRDTLIDEELSIGDYVLTNGTLAAAVIIDALARFIPGVLGEEKSLTTESFTRNLLDFPNYTRPAVFRGMSVPEVLLQGNHGEIDKWRHAQQLAKTAKVRPDLLKKQP